jgi:hypothetical protein
MTTIIRHPATAAAACLKGIPKTDVRTASSDLPDGSACSRYPCATAPKKAPAAVNPADILGEKPCWERVEEKRVRRWWKRKKVG